MTIGRDWSKYKKDDNGKIIKNEVGAWALAAGGFEQQKPRKPRKRKPAMKQAVQGEKSSVKTEDSVPLHLLMKIKDAADLARKYPDLFKLFA